MKVNFLYKKGVGVLNEDQLFMANNVFAVFDGVTSLDKYVDKNGKTGGYVASFLLKSSFEKYRNDKNKKILDIIREGNEDIENNMLHHSIDLRYKENRWGTTVAVVKLYEDKIEYAQIANSLIMVIYRDKSYKVIDDNFDHDKKIRDKWVKLPKHLSSQDKRKQLSDFFINTRKLQNIKYGILNGEPEYIDFLHHGLIENVDNISDIVLFTDGLIPPSKNEFQNNFEIFIEKYLENGLDSIYKYIREIENRDINCNLYPRFKIHDDVAAISIKL